MSSNEYTDDATIDNDADLWRRIPPWHLVHDHNQNRIRPTSAAFEDDEDGSPMSVVLADVVIEAGRSETEILVGHEGFAMAAITAGLGRECAQKIVRNPLPEEPAHALLVGRKTDSVRKRFAKSCRWVIHPDPSFANH